MPRKSFQKVNLHDNYPSDITGRVTIRESIWNIVSSIESNQWQDSPLFIEPAEMLSSDTLDIDLPLSFGKQPPLKKAKKRKKSRGSMKEDIHQKFITFSETKFSHNLYMGLNEGDGLFYPCRVLGLGPSSIPSQEFSMVQFIGYGTYAELERTVGLQPIPVERLNEIHEYVMNETLYQAMGSVDDLKKYYDQRFRLFSKFDQGIMLDKESWFSITPECISHDIADKCRSHAMKLGVQIGMILDCFCGVGGNVIAMAARSGCHVVCAVDIDKHKLDMLRCNAKIYGVDSRIDCINDDAYKMLSNISKNEGRLMGGIASNSGLVSSESSVSSFTDIDRNEHLLTKDARPDLTLPYTPVVNILVLAPPWGGIDYTNTKSAFDLRTMITSGDGMDLFDRAVSVCSNIIYILPKNTKKKDLVDLGHRSGLYCRIEDVHIHNKLKMIVAYYGPLFSS